MPIQIEKIAQQLTGSESMFSRIDVNTFPEDKVVTPLSLLFAALREAQLTAADMGINLTEVYFIDLSTFAQIALPKIAEVYGWVTEDVKEATFIIGEESYKGDAIKVLIGNPIPGMAINIGSIIKPRTNSIRFFEINSHK